MPAYVIYGDNFLVTRHLKGLYTQIGPPEVWDTNIHHVVGAQAKFEELATICNAAPFLASYRLVIVDGLLSTFETRDRRARGQFKTPQSLGQWEGLKTLVPNLPATTLLVFTDGPVGQQNLLLTLLRPFTEVKHLPTPAGEELARWVKTRASEKGATFSPGALRTLLQMVGNDLWALDNELEKLSLYVNGRTVEERDVHALVSQVREASIFTAIDAVLDGRISVALRILKRLQESGTTVQSFLSIMARQLRLIALAKDLVEQGATGQEIGQKLGITQDFVARKVVDQARRFSWSDLERLYRALLRTDLAVKTGQVEEKLALELMLPSLSIHA